MLCVGSQKYEWESLFINMPNTDMQKNFLNKKCSRPGCVDATPNLIYCDFHCCHCNFVCHRCWCHIWAETKFWQAVPKLSDHEREQDGPLEQSPMDRRSVRVNLPCWSSHYLLVSSFFSFILEHNFFSDGQSTSESQTCRLIVSWSTEQELLLRLLRLNIFRSLPRVAVHPLIERAFSICYSVR